MKTTDRKYLVFLMILLGVMILSIGVVQADTLTVYVSGTGAVTSSPAGINCGSACSAQFPSYSISGSPVQLNPTVTPGNNFLGWIEGGFFVNGGQLNVFLSGDTAVIAYFSAGSFADVYDSSNVFLNYIETIKKDGVTVGCSAAGDVPRYCPADNVTRGQMAAFIVRALQVAAGQPAESFTCSGGVDCSTTTPYFSDVLSNNGFFKYIQKLKQLNITAIPQGSAYGVNQPVTREQMAAFLVRGIQVKSNAPTEGYTCTGGVAGASVSCSSVPAYFTDVPSTDNFFPYVQKLHETGITVVTGTYNVSGGIVTRDQMAAFISRAFLGMK